jgi:Hg(II)-responsive transcriptional regulator
MRIGEVAARAGVKIQTLRYYERRGLLEEPRRTSSGYRQYSAETVRVLRFIKRAQELGFTLAEIQDLLRLREDRESNRAEVQAVARTKVEDIEGRIRSLQAMRRALGVLVDCCGNETSPRECPILEALERDLRHGN